MTKQTLLTLTISVVLLVTVSGCGGKEDKQPAETQETMTSELPKEFIGKDGNPMVLIPAGKFKMGQNEKIYPLLHTVYLDAYYIDAYEVTNAQYAKFMNESGMVEDPVLDKLIGAGGKIVFDGGKPRAKDGFADHPVDRISWYAAAAYAQFYGKRLPTEAEWEKAARGGLERKYYPWGNTITHDDANYSGTGGKDAWEETAPVGSFAPNGYGLYDVIGNASEWCADHFDLHYYEVSPTINPRGPGLVIMFKNDDFLSIRTDRVSRGGNWALDDPEWLFVSIRGSQVPSNPTEGFRCAQDAAP